MDNIYDRFNSRIGLMLRVAIEAVVLLTVAVAPWAFGAVEPVSRFAISIALGLLLVLAALRLILSRNLTRHGNGVFCCLAGFFLLSLVQNLGMPASLLKVLSPGSADAYAY